MKQEVILTMVPVDHPYSAAMKELVGDYVPAPFSIKVPCEKCGRICWMGPKGQELKKAQPETPAICALCTAKKVKEDGGEFAMKDLGGYSSTTKQLPKN